MFAKYIWIIILIKVPGPRSFGGFAILTSRGWRPGGRCVRGKCDRHRLDTDNAEKEEEELMRSQEDNEFWRRMPPVAVVVILLDDAEGTATNLSKENDRLEFLIWMVEEDVVKKVVHGDE